MKPRTGFAALNILLLALGGVAHGASDNHKESLRGLTGVCVRLQPLSDGQKQDGLDARSIQTNVEQKLKQAGINVLTPSQAAQAPGSPTLYILINAKELFYPTGVTFDPAGRPYNDPPYIVMVTVSLLQDAMSVRDPKLRLKEAKTWDAGYLRPLERQLLRQAAGTVGDLVDEFVADWRAVNSKK
jgi:hypothetical protein